MTSKLNFTGWIVINQSTGKPCGVYPDNRGGYPFGTNDPTKVHFFNSLKDATGFVNRSFRGFNHQLSVRTATITLTYKVEDNHAGQADAR